MTDFFFSLQKVETPEVLYEAVVEVWSQDMNNRLP